jgi:hypothetical protein
VGYAAKKHFAGTVVEILSQAIVDLWRREDVREARHIPMAGPSCFIDGWIASS